jgi:protein-disulfide isomerase
MRDLWDKVLSGVLGLAAAVMAVVLIHREFFAVAPGGLPSRVSSYVSEWRHYTAAGRTMGDSQAPITILAFSDLQCPFCARFHAAVRRVQQKYPDRVRYSFVHYPLPMHPQALAAARAVECARASNRFAQAVDFVFANQDSLGKRDWSWFGRGAGVTDTARFRRCVADTTTVPIIREGLELGSKVAVRGTPTVLLNGWRYGGVPSDTELIRATDDLLAGRKPYRGFPESGLPPR